MMHQLGIDLGGTKIEGIVLADDGSHLYRNRIPTEQEGGYEHILARVHSLYETLCEQIKGGEHTFGLGAPGAISQETGFLKNSNTACLNQKPIKDDLELRLGRKIAIENDANCFAMAEALLGAGAGCGTVFGVIMGTGCGGGIVHRGKVIDGLQTIAGEWGHMTIDPQGPECYCGKRGCVETFISGGGLEAKYAAEFKEKKALKDIVEAFRAQDPQATAFMHAFFENYGRALSNLINILDPDMIVLGGGVSNIEELYSLGQKQVERFVFSDSLKTPIVQHELGDSAGVIGAALIGV